MRLSFSQQIRQQQVQKLAPRMIQSMEILQLSVMQLQERIEQEMTENPTIELQQDSHEDDSPAESEEYDIEKELVVDQDSDNADDFQRLDDMHLDVPDHFDEQPRISADRIQ
ncbi:MAG TPA: RNA polymerase sigma-54 factor, partial [Planctomycetaceae bacterium]|nr:RNA polymerase sigma-54 factor [Planctomycetaceae bacterium]